MFEKILASLGGRYAVSNKTLFKIISIIVHKNIKLKKVNQIESQGLIKRKIKRLKFDLVNMINEGMPFS